MQKSKVKTEKMLPGGEQARLKAQCRRLTLLTLAFCLLTFAFAFCLLPTVLSAQGCAMCYNSASAAKAGAKEALANGVLILLVPPMVFFVLIAVVVYLYRNKFRDTSVVRGQLPVDPANARWSEQSAQAPGWDFWVSDQPMIRSADPFPRATDNRRRTMGKQFPCAG